jgi:hypothetical protein
VRKEVPLKEEDEWWSPIQKLVLSVDMDRHEQKNIQLPDRYGYYFPTCASIS